MGWLSTVANIADVASTGLSLYSSFSSASAAKSQASQQVAYNTETAQANAALSRYDANVSRLAAYQVRAAESQAIKLHRENVNKYLSAQKTKYAKSGVLVDSGSAAEVAAKTIADGKADEYTIRNEYNNKALSYESLATRYDMLAESGLRDAATYSSLLTSAANNRATGYYIQGASTLLSSIGEYFT